jgi:hypothetical protein
MSKILTKDIITVKSFDDVIALDKLYDRTTNIQFNCEKCGRLYTATIRFTKSKGECICKQCNIKKTKLERYGDKNYNNVEKNKETCLKHFGVDSWAKTEKGKESFNKSVNSKVSIDKRVGTYKSHMKDPDFKKNLWEKRKATLIQKYGSWDNYIKEASKKSEATCMSKYGVPNAGALQGGNEFESINKYFYDNRYFDSSWELQYYIYLKDNKINFEYHNGLYLEYIKNEKIHRYYPDFIINGQYVEIKGDLWYNECNNEILDKSGNVNVEKTRCLEENNVMIMNSTKLQHVFTYINYKYGKDYIKSFKIKKEKTNLHWWNNGIKCRRSETCPGDGWVRGML